jgi:Transposase IS116/IS110/IS902 family
MREDSDWPVTGFGSITRSPPGSGKTSSNASKPMRPPGTAMRRRVVVQVALMLGAMSGSAPVTKRSGKSRIVVRRLACHPRLRNALYHWARVAVQIDETSKAKYAALRSRGHSHARALRSAGDRFLAVACAMLENRTMFNP